MEELRGRAGLSPPLAWHGAALEVETEAQLCALHALANWRVQGEGAEVREALQGSVGWLLEHLQPDNGTNHPWGVHAFVMVAAERRGGSAAEGALAYAGTLLHNAMVGLGRPDEFSAWILEDAGRALEVAAGRGAG